jgi:hypothetical protein
MCLFTYSSEACFGNVIILKSVFGTLDITRSGYELNDRVQFPVGYRSQIYSGTHPTSCLLGVEGSVHLIQVSSLQTHGAVLHSPYVFVQHGDN